MESSGMGAGSGSTTPAKVRFALYTNEDFTGNAGNIHFTLFMRNGNKMLWDSVLPVMKIGDIPDSTHPLVVEKNTPAGNSAILEIGFHYEIENVGESEVLDTCAVGNTLKIFNFAFR